MNRGNNSDITREKEERDNAVEERLTAQGGPAQECDARSSAQQRPAGEPEVHGHRPQAGTLGSEGFAENGRPGLYAGVGGDDLRPLGPDIINSGPGGTRGGGMLVGPGHPMFGQGTGDDEDDDGYGGMGPLAGPERLPQGAVPPGARFDPVMPFGPAASARGGRGRGRGRGARGPFGGDPDNDAFMPPGSGFGGGFGSGPDSFL
ncbi:hypothetical protein EV175_003366 [Coemansia sp. RSA 1933]|nr:hypothetical protein EV175_003366 [Coemansia sp. RSA 1933]